MYGLSCDIAPSHRETEEQRQQVAPLLGHSCEDDECDECEEILEQSRRLAARSMSLEALRTHFSTGKGYWDRSKTRQRLYDSIASKNHTSKINKIICIGLGTLSDPYTVSDREECMIQLALMLDLAYWVRNSPAHDGYNVRLYAQDPAFIDLDKDLLKEKNIEVVERKIWSRIDDRTLVFGPFVPKFALTRSFCETQFTRFGGAAIMIWNNLEKRYICVEDCEDFCPHAQKIRYENLTRQVRETYTHERFPHSVSAKAKHDTEGLCDDDIDEELTTNSLKGLHVYWSNDLAQDEASHGL